MVGLNHLSYLIKLPKMSSLTSNYKALSPSLLPLSIEKWLKKVHQLHHKLVLVTGVFDVLHQEHRLFLEKAKAAGDNLIVGLESDVRIRQLKGEGRPVNSERTRVENLQNWELADQIFILPDDFSRPEDHRALIHHLRPAVLAVSAHSPHLEVKQRILAEVGSMVSIVHAHNPAMSTTILLQDQKK